MAYTQQQGVLKPFALAAMRLAFTEGGELGRLDVIQEVGTRVGLAPDDLAAAVQRQEIKDALRAANDEAVSFGVFGVPTVVVDGQRFWGDDQLETAAQEARRKPDAG